MIDDARSEIRLPHSESDPRFSVTMYDSDFPGRIVAWFASREEFLGVELVSDDPLPADAFRLVGRRLELYRDYAHAWLRHWLQGESDVAQQMRRLRLLGKTKRGYGDDFYRALAREYDELVAAGEQHIGKAVAAKYHVDKSRASRWLATARERGFV